MYHIIKKIAFIALITASGFGTLLAQSSNKTQKLASLVEAFELVIQNYAADSLYKANAIKWDKTHLKTLFQPQVHVKGSPNLQNLVDYNKNQLRKDLGFDLSAGFLNNFEQSLLDSEGRFYRRRYTVGTRWDLLGGGLLDNRLNAKLLDYDLAKQSVVNESAAMAESVDIVYQRILFVFNKAKQQEIGKYLIKLDQELSLLRSLSDLGYDVKELFRDLARKQLRYELQLQDFQKFEQNLDSAAYVVEPIFWETQPALFDLAIDSVQQNAISRQYIPIDKLVEIESSKNQEAFKRWREVSVNLQFQYNYFDRLEEQSNNQFLNDREFFSLTGTVRIPLTIFSTNYNKAAQLTTFKYKEQLEKTVQNRDNELVGQYREFENRKRGIFEIEAEIDVVNQRINDEKRQFQINKQNYNPALLLSQISKRQSLVIERLIALEEYYLTFYKIWRHAPENILENFAHLSNQPFGTASSSKSNTGVYLWSEALYGYNNTYIKQKLHEFGVNKVALSVGQLKPENRQKVSALIAELQAEKMEIALLIGNNAIVQDTVFTKVSEWVRLAAALNLATLHYDVEPHALPTWNTNKAALLNNYVKLLAYTAKEASLYGIALEVSIPYFYDDILAQITSYASKINVMVYEDLTISSIHSKLNEEKRILGADKWALSLRASDFSSKEQLTIFLKSLRNSLKNESVYFHDFKGLDSLK